MRRQFASKIMKPEGGLGSRLGRCEQGFRRIGLYIVDGGHLENVNLPLREILADSWKKG